MELKATLNNSALRTLFFVLFFYLSTQFFYTETGYKENLQLLLQWTKDNVIVWIDKELGNLSRNNVAYFDINKFQMPILFKK